MSKNHVKTGDHVIVLSGKDKDKKGKVLAVYPDSGKLLVEKVNMVIRHSKPRRQGEEGGRLSKESPIYGCKVMHICSKCGQPTRVGRKILDDGQKSRYCKKCLELLDE